MSEDSSPFSKETVFNFPLSVYTDILAPPSSTLSALKYPLPFQKPYLSFESSQVASSLISER